MTKDINLFTPLATYVDSYTYKKTTYIRETVTKINVMQSLLNLLIKN